jgi:hypothetical protein
MWSRVPYTTLVAVPALAASALRVDPTGAENTVRPFLGYYVLALEPAPCAQAAECLMGGSPVLLVEQGQADFNHLDEVQPLLVIDLTPRVQSAAVIMALVIVGLVGFIIRWRRRRRS